MSESKIHQIDVTNAQMTNSTTTSPKSAFKHYSNARIALYKDTC
jgi:hypothetical protein